MALTPRQIKKLTNRLDKAIVDAPDTWYTYLDEEQLKELEKYWYDQWCWDSGDSKHEERFRKAEAIQKELASGYHGYGFFSGVSTTAKYIGIFSQISSSNVTTKIACTGSIGGQPTQQNVVQKQVTISKSGSLFGGLIGGLFGRRK